MSKIFRNDSNKAQSFWSSAESVAAPVRQWPDWKRAGINVSPTRILAISREEIPLKAIERVKTKKG
jgi:hypothetical protein